jgi:hypothetical protein
MQVLTYDEAAKRAAIVRRTLERLIAIGEGPAVVELSTRRRGILETDCRFPPRFDPGFPSRTDPAG